jgi:hypothetical protein
MGVLVCVARERLHALEEGLGELRRRSVEGGELDVLLLAEPGLLDSEPCPRQRPAS